MGPLTPTEAFLRLQASPAHAPVGLLESTRSVVRTGRYSFIALNPYLRMQSFGTTIHLSGAINQTLCGRPLPIVQQILPPGKYHRVPEAPPFLGGAIGYFGYDLVHFFERLPRRTATEPQLPDLDLYFVGTVVAFDHQEQTVTVAHSPPAHVRHAGSPVHHRESTTIVKEIRSVLSRRLPDQTSTRRPDRTPAIVTPGQSQQQYETNVRRALDYIAAGDIFQANLAHRFSIEIGARNPWAIYQQLNTINPSPFSAYLDMDPLRLICASPERLVSLRHHRVETRPIAGTRPRSRDQHREQALIEELLTSQKERAEHLMLVDLERNDLGRVCDYGSIKVDELMVTERYSHVSHLVSNITGRLHTHKNWLDLFRAVFPGGTVTGVPKVRGMEIINELEPVSRGVYSGSIGYISHSGDLDLNIVIRTLVVHKETAYLHVGAGIVADSDPASEYAETLYKAQALREAIEAA